MPNHCQILCPPAYGPGKLQQLASRNARADGPFMAAGNRETWKSLVKIGVRGP